MVWVRDLGLILSGTHSWVLLRAQHCSALQQKKQSRLDVRKFSFSQRTINVWNKLPAECLHASSICSRIE